MVIFTIDIKNACKYQMAKTKLIGVLVCLLVGLFYTYMKIGDYCIPGIIGVMLSILISLSVA